MPIGVVLELLATLGIFLAIFLHCGSVITCTEGSCCQSSTPDVTPTDPLVELSHDSHALLSVYTYQKRVRKPKPVQLAIDEGEPAGVLLYLFGLCRVHWEHAIRHVALVGRVHVSGLWIAQTCVIFVAPAGCALTLRVLKVS